MSFIKWTLKSFVIAFILFAYLQYHISIQRFLFTQDMILTVAPLCGKSSLRNFEDADRMDLYSSSIGGMSSSYNDYLNWLSTNPAFSEVANDLRNGFSEGLTPMNYALPYVDKDKLEDDFNALFQQQLSNFTEETYCDITNIEGTISNIDRQFYNFNSRAVTWGIGSSFYSNTTGHEMLYNYDNYLTYIVTFHVDVTVDVKYGFTDISSGQRHVVTDIPIIYELLN